MMGWEWVLYGGMLSAVLAVAGEAMFRRLYARSPQAGDNPVQIGTTPAWPLVSLEQVIADLEACGSTVAAEFRPPADHVDQRTIAGGGLLMVPDDVDVLDMAHGVTVLRTARPEAVRIHHGGYGGYSGDRPASAMPPPARFPSSFLRPALDREAQKIRRRAYQQLLSTRAGDRRPPPVPPGGGGIAIPEPTVGPVGPSGCSSAWSPGPHGIADVRAAVRPQPSPPAAPPRPGDPFNGLPTRTVWE